MAYHGRPSLAQLRRGAVRAARLVLADRRVQADFMEPGRLRVDRELRLALFVAVDTIGAGAGDLSPRELPEALDAWLAADPTPDWARPAP